MHPTANQTDYEIYTAIKIGCAIFYLSNLVCGLFGSLVLCGVVIKCKTLRSSTGLLIFNLAFSGLIKSVFCVPILLFFTVFYLDTSHNIALCHVEQIFRHISSYAELFTMVNIAYERHQAIAKPFEKLERMFRIKITIPIIWICSVLLGFLGDFVFFDYTDQVVCLRKYNADEMGIIHMEFGLYFNVTIGILAVIMLIYLYISILWLVRKHTQKLFGGKAISKKNKVQPVVTLTHDPVEDFNKKNKECLNSVNPTDVSIRESINTQISSSPSDNMGVVQDKHLLINNEEDKQYSNEAFKSEESMARKQKSEEVSVIARNETNNDSKFHHKDNIQFCVPNELFVVEDARSSVSTICQEVTVTKADEKVDISNSEKVIEVHDIEGRVVKEKLAIFSNKFQTDDVTGPVCVFNPKNRERGRRKIEAKTAQTTALAVMCFLVCWFPYPATILVVYTGSRSSGILSERLFNYYVLSMSLSSVSATINPFIYGIFNNQFRSEFKRLFQMFKKFWFNNNLWCKLKK